MDIEDYISFGMWDDFYDDQFRSLEPVTVKIDRYITETRLAFLFVIQGHEVWLPKSQVTLHGPTREVTMPQWLYQDKNLH